MGLLHQAMSVWFSLMSEAQIHKGILEPKAHINTTCSHVGEIWDVYVYIYEDICICIYAYSIKYVYRRYIYIFIYLF